MRFDDQAEFHARKYLLALAEQLDATVYEHSHAVQVDDDERCTVKTPGGRVTADRVVVATHYPFLDRALAFARVLPAALLRAAVPDRGRAAGGHVHQRRLAHALGPRGPARDGEELLLVGGEGHKTGEGGDTEERYARARGVRARALGRALGRVPLVGAGRHDDRRRALRRPAHARSTTSVLMATGFAKWGMTGGTAAAMMLADRLLGRENPWAGLFDPNRLKPRAVGAAFVKENAQGRGCTSSATG